MKYPNIEAERVRAGMTRGQLAHVLGIGMDTYNFYVTGKSRIHYDTAAKLAEMFNVPVEYLMQEAKS